MLCSPLNKWLDVKEIFIRLFIPVDFIYFIVNSFDKSSVENSAKYSEKLIFFKFNLFG
jgi:hypothetical protein